jgi:hypothetical protein
MAQPSDWARFLSAIRAQESGGNYAEDVPGCLGAYCWNNQSSWDNMAAAAGLHQFVGQNPATLQPSVQDQVASANMGRIWGQTGSLDKVAMWWNGGSTTSEPNPGLPFEKWAPQCGGGSSAAYACQVLTRMKLGGHFLATGSGSGGSVQTSASADCLIGFGGIPGTSWINDIFGSGGNLGQVCLLSRPEARALVGGAIMLLGGLIMLPGVLLVMAGAGTIIGGTLGKAQKELTGTAKSAGFKGSGSGDSGKDDSGSDDKDKGGGIIAGGGKPKSKPKSTGKSAGKGGRRLRSVTGGGGSSGAAGAGEAGGAAVGGAEVAAVAAV